MGKKGKRSSKEPRIKTGEHLQAPPLLSKPPSTGNISTSNGKGMGSSNDSLIPQNSGVSDISDMDSDDDIE
ncbi:hypothetical protein SARC_15095, partial [Sphaeroforma arctica JP610]